MIFKRDKRIPPSVTRYSLSDGRKFERHEPAKSNEQLRILGMIYPEAVLLFSMRPDFFCDIWIEGSWIGLGDSQNWASCLLVQDNLASIFSISKVPLIIEKGRQLPSSQFSFPYSHRSFPEIGKRVKISTGQIAPPGRRNHDPSRKRS
jgi:hypothetical protein